MLNITFPEATSHFVNPECKNGEMDHAICTGRMCENFGICPAEVRKHVKFV